MTFHDRRCCKQVKEGLYSQRKNSVKISGDSMCSLCNKKIGTSVFAVYPNGKTLVHFVCFKDSQNMKTGGKGSRSPYQVRWHWFQIIYWLIVYWFQLSPGAWTAHFRNLAQVCTSLFCFLRVVLVCEGFWWI